MGKEQYLTRGGEGNSFIDKAYQFWYYVAVLKLLFEEKEL